MYRGLARLHPEENLPASLKLMGRALTRLDHLFIDSPAGRLCWIGSAAIESQLDGQLLPRRSRKQLFSRLDRELKQVLGNPTYEAPRSLLGIAIRRRSGGQQRSDCQPVRQVFSLSPLPFTDHLLEDESQRLAGPGRHRSLSSAIREELASLKDLLDLIERGTAQAEAYSNLHNLLGKMAKTLGMVGLSSAASTLQAQLGDVRLEPEQAPESQAILRLADAVLYVESMVASRNVAIGAIANLRSPVRAWRRSLRQPPADRSLHRGDRRGDRRACAGQARHHRLSRVQRREAASGQRAVQPAGCSRRFALPRAGACCRADRSLCRFHPEAHARVESDAPSSCSRRLPTP